MIGRVPGFEISGWPRAALEAFSSRRRQILDYIREKGWRYDARAAQAAGEAGLAAGAGERAFGLGQEARLWSWKLENVRFLPLARAEERMAPPRSAADVRAWRDLRERQAPVRQEAGTIAGALAGDGHGLSADEAARWREEAALYRNVARRIRAALPALADLEARIRLAAAWAAAAEAAERLKKGAGHALREEAEAAAGRARHEAARQRSATGVAEERPAQPDTAEVRAARDCRRIREAFEHAAAEAGEGALIYRPGMEALGGDAARLLATPWFSDRDRRYLEQFKAVIDSEARVRDMMRDAIRRARAHLGEYPDILDRTLAPEPPAPEEPAPAKAGEPPARPGLAARARRLFRTEEDIPACAAPPAPQALNDFDPDYRLWDIRAEQFVETFRNWRAIDDPAHCDHLDRRWIDMADLLAEIEAIRRAARDPEAEPHRIEIPDAGAFAAADQRHDLDRLDTLLRAAVRPEDERDRGALLELARRNRAWPRETRAAFRSHVRDAVDADDTRSLSRMQQGLPATLARSFENLSEECWRHMGEVLARRQELTREHGLSY